MARYSCKRKTQALLELTIFGTLFLFVLGILIQYGARLNARQELLMKSYRHAIRQASKTGIGDNYLDYSAAYIKDVPIPDVSSPYGIGRLSSLSTGASARRTYFLMNAEEPHDDAMPRTHYVINDKERLDYDPGSGDGFTTMALRRGHHITRQGSDFVIIRVIADTADQIAPADVYWTWVRITINSLTPDEQSEGYASEEKIEDLFAGGAITGSIVNLGTDLDNPLNIPLTEDDIFVKVLEWPVVDSGTRLHSSCLDEAINPYRISVIKLYDEGRVDVKGSGWAEINQEDVTDTARGISYQGLQREETQIINKNSLRIVNDKQGNQFSTQTPVDYQDKVVRTIRLRTGHLEIESRRNINENKYNWRSSY